MLHWKICHWQSQISELLHSVLKILNFWNKFWIICLLWWQKIGHQAHKIIVKFSKITFQKFHIFQYRIRSNPMVYIWIKKASIFKWKLILFLRRAHAGTQASKITCAIYCMHKIIVLSLFVFLISIDST